MSAICEIFGSCPMSISNLSVNIHRIYIGIQTRIRKMMISGHKKSLVHRIVICLLHRLVRIKSLMHQPSRTA